MYFQQAVQVSVDVVGFNLRRKRRYRQTGVDISCCHLTTRMKAQYSASGWNFSHSGSPWKDKIEQCSKIVMPAIACITVPHRSIYRIHHVAPMCTPPHKIHGTLGSRESDPQTAFRSVRPFLQGSCIVVVMNRDNTLYVFQMPFPCKPGWAVTPRFSSTSSAKEPLGISGARILLASMGNPYSESWRRKRKGWVGRICRKGRI